MICPICRSFKRGTYPNSDLWAKHPYDRLLSSCKSCQCCDIIVRGCRGLLLALNRPDHNITTCELQLAYENGDGQDESDCNKVIALAFSSGEWIYIEFFAAEGKDLSTYSLLLISTDYKQMLINQPRFRNIGTTSQRVEGRHIILNQRKRLAKFKPGLKNARRITRTALPDKTALSRRDWSVSGYTTKILCW